MRFARSVGSAVAQSADVPAASNDVPCGRHVGPVAAAVMGVLLFAVALALMQSLVELWTAVDSATQTRPNGVAAPDHEIAILFGSIRFGTVASTSLIVLAFLGGGLGAFLHVATSFTTFVGNRTLLWRWMLWYPARLLIGSTLGAVFYFLVRGGFFSSSTLTSDINPYGIAGLAALVGMLSKQATDKLTNLFEALFGQQPSQGDEGRLDKANPTRDECPTAPSAPAISTKGGTVAS